jgi:hypothetical protein
VRQWLSTIPFCSQGAPEMDLLLENRPNEKFLSFKIKNIYNCRLVLVRVTSNTYILVVLKFRNIVAD